MTADKRQAVAILRYGEDAGTGTACEQISGYCFLQESFNGAAHGTRAKCTMVASTHKKFYRIGASVNVMAQRAETRARSAVIKSVQISRCTA